MQLAYYVTARMERTERGLEAGEVPVRAKRLMVYLPSVLPFTSLVTLGI